jgi:hypothetical protein
MSQGQEEVRDPPATTPSDSVVVSSNGTALSEWDAEYEKSIGPTTFASVVYVLFSLSMFLVFSDWWGRNSYWWVIFSEFCFVSLSFTASLGLLGDFKDKRVVVTHVIVNIINTIFLLAYFEIIIVGVGVSSSLSAMQYVVGFLLAVIILVAQAVPILRLWRYARAFRDSGLIAPRRSAAFVLICLSLSLSLLFLRCLYNNYMDYYYPHPTLHFSDVKNPGATASVYLILFFISVGGIIWSSVVLLKTRTPSGGYRETDDEGVPGSMEMTPARFEIGDPDPESPPPVRSGN